MSVLCRKKTAPKPSTTANPSRGWATFKQMLPSCCATASPTSDSFQRHCAGRWAFAVKGGTDVESSMRTISIDDARIFAITLNPSEKGGQGQKHLAMLCTKIKKRTVRGNPRACTSRQWLPEIKYKTQLLAFIQKRCKTTNTFSNKTRWIEITCNKTICTKTL